MVTEEISIPEVTHEKIHSINDESFTTDNCCIVTGAASGIGHALTLAAAENGLTVVATDVDAEGLSATKRRAEAIGVAGQVETINADLTDDDDTKQLVEAAAEYGNIKYLANIAGLQHIDPIEKFPMETYDRIHKVMLRAPLHLSKLCIPHMRRTENGQGCVGNMASVHGHYTTAEKAAYNISKFGIRGLTQSIAAEGNGEVRAFSVSTGYVQTPLVTNQIPDTAESRGLTVQEVVEDVMLGQSRVKVMMEPVDVANLFIIGFSEIARHLNGGDLLFDGGMTLTYE